MVELTWMGACVFLLSMSKGGFPIGSVALPILILVWPDEAGAARSAVAFLLPVLCAMDLVALCFYWKRVQWTRIVPLLPGTLVGVAIGSALFVSDEAALLAVSDRALKLSIGLLGLLFVAYRAGQKWLLNHLSTVDKPGWGRGSGFGMAAGLTSTLAHAGGPVMQMYLLPQGLGKLQFAGTAVAYFWMLNLVKMVPFAALGRIQPGNLKLALVLLPVVPLGVGAGYLAVRLIKGRHYIGFIYTVLFLSSVLLIVKSLSG